MNWEALGAVGEILGGDRRRRFAFLCGTTSKRERSIYTRTNLSDFGGSVG